VSKVRKRQTVALWIHCGPSRRRRRPAALFSASLGVPPLVRARTSGAELPSMHQLEVAPTATMWMHLGSVIGGIEHYEHAWTLSNQHLARAKLKLCSNAMRLEQWEEARTEGASTHPAGGLATSSCGQASGQAACWHQNADADHQRRQQQLQQQRWAQEDRPMASSWHFASGSYYGTGNPGI